MSTPEMITFSSGFCAGAITVWVNLKYGKQIDAAGVAVGYWIRRKLARSEGK